MAETRTMMHDLTADERHVVMHYLRFERLGTLLRHIWQVRRMNKGSFLIAAYLTDPFAPRRAPTPSQPEDA